MNRCERGHGLHRGLQRSLSESDELLDDKWSATRVISEGAAGLADKPLEPVRRCRGRADGPSSEVLSAIFTAAGMRATLPLMPLLTSSPWLHAATRWASPSSTAAAALSAEARSALLLASVAAPIAAASMAAATAAAPPALSLFTSPELSSLQGEAVREITSSPCSICPRASPARYPRSSVGVTETSVARGAVPTSSVAIEVTRACFHAACEKPSIFSPSTRPSCSPKGMCRKASRKYQRNPSTKKNAKSLRTSCSSNSRVVR